MGQGHRIIEENLRVAMSCFARSTAEGEAIDLPGVRLVFTGVREGVFNAVMLTEPVAFLSDLRRRLERARDYFLRRRFPWSMWLCEDMLDPGLVRLLPALMAEYDLSFSSRPPGMIAEQLAEPERKLPTLEFRPIGDTTTRIDFCHLMAIAFEGPFAATLDAYNAAEFWHGDFKGFLGYAPDGRAITSACTVQSETSTGIYAVATVVSERRRGYGEAVMRHALAANGASAPVVLQSSAKGLSLYQQMGFQRETDFVIYVSPPDK